MTLDTCKRLLAHFEATAKDESVPAHIRNDAKVHVQDMKNHIARKQELLKKK